MIYGGKMDNILELKKVSLTYHTLIDEIIAVKDFSFTAKKANSFR